ncbi:hypothetical protein [Nocardioides alcanivorans]|uniref:hypothetical protein n=1 Tax=Nocardioides alcanivorans TaxID=2897352 RepID=UPI001F439630|nr:hypothetical protein [Nocardioides alcanivorans]
MTEKADTTPVLFADDIELREPRRTLLARTKLGVAPGEVVVAIGRPGSGHTVVSLALAGRIVPTSGRVLLGESQEPRELQSAVVLVDVPGVSEPDDNIPLHVIVGEELAMAGRPARRSAVREVLAEHEMTAHEDLPIGEVPAVARVRLMADLAASRPGVAHVVLTYPERHGTQPEQVLDIARGLAERGFGVLVTASPGFPVPDDLRMVHIGREETR